MGPWRRSSFEAHHLRRRRRSSQQVLLFFGIPLFFYIVKKPNYERTEYKFFDDRLEFEEGFFSLNKKVIKLRDVFNGYMASEVFISPPRRQGRYRPRRQGRYRRPTYLRRLVLAASHPAGSLLETLRIRTGSMVEFLFLSKMLDRFNGDLITKTRGNVELTFARGRVATIASGRADTFGPCFRNGRSWRNLSVALSMAFWLTPTVCVGWFLRSCAAAPTVPAHTLLAPPGLGPCCGSGRAWRSTMSTEIKSKSNHSHLPWNNPRGNTEPHSAMPWNNRQPGGVDDRWCRVRTASTPH